MVALMGCALLCLALGRERSLASGWLPGILMLAASVVGIPHEGAGLAIVGSAAMLVVAGGLAARGRDRSMALHRGLSAVAMAGACFGGIALPTLATSSHGHSATGAEIGVVLLALDVGVVAAGVHAIRGDLGGVAGADAAGAFTTRARIAEVVVMTTAVVAMSVHS
jgi:hypothetical protein